MGHVDLAAPVSHIWFFKGVPSRIGYLLDMAPKELEKVLYFAASIVTWVDDESRQKDLSTLETEVDKQIVAYEGEREQRVLELRESLDRRIGYLSTGDQKGFNDDDLLWADTLDVNLKKLSDDDREKMEKEIKKQFEADISDTEAYYEDGIERMRQTWELFQTMEPKQVVADETLFRELKDRFGSPFGWGEYFRGGMGAESVRDLLEQVDLDAEREELEDLVKTAKGQKQSRAVKRLKVVSAFINSDNKPEDMVLEAIPVIPPELRPMVQLDGGRFATSDLNDLYRRVINRNNRLKRLLDLGAPEIIVNNEKRMLQEAVDALFDNGRRGRPVTGPGNRPLKSLSDMLKGKQGRFRQNLLGKRVDYSGRSVIVAGPELRIHQCGLPKLMALELFKPFIMARLVERKSVQNIKAAKKMVDSMIPEVWDVLEEVIQEHPVLLNRAPTLHRLGLQAFEPVLVEGKAIQVHPLVCHAFNADFDGDQMAVHVPLSAEAQAEARLLMLSANNILSPAHGKPLATPSQDMVLGSYYLTYGPDAQELADLERILFEGKWNEKKNGPRPHVFRSAQEAELSYESKVVNLHDLSEYRRRHHGEHVLTTVGRIIFNERIERALEDALGDEYDPATYEFVNTPLKKRDMSQVIEGLVDLHGPYATALVLDAFKELGFHFASQAGITISKNDVVIPPDKEEILERYEGEVSEVQDQYDMGLITEDERRVAVTDKWQAATDEVGEAMQRNLDRLNPIFMMANSGARGSFKQIRQLAGMRGLMANPKGEIIERPIKANFMEGLTVLEYFISTHGARKGLADTALRTADSGYLTRRLVDVAQDVIVREEDCGTKEFIQMPLLAEDGSANDQLEGRFAAEDFATKRGRGLLEKGQLITAAEVDEMKEAYGEQVTVPVRSVLKCRTEGVCQHCYGVAPATGKVVAIGDAIGIIAAQSIGEPGTQLTLRTFHTGGVAGADITHGLPRVVELFEARKPKGLAELATEEGTVAVEETEKGLKVLVSGADDEEQSYSFPRRTRLLVEPGQKVKPGHQLNEGSIYPHDLLAYGGSDPLERRTATEVYLVEEVQKVYKSQGVDINDKHIEVIVRQMMKKVRVDQKGDTTYLPGQFVDRNEIMGVNTGLKKGKKEQAQVEEIILGITKASLATDSFLSAASFQETTKVLTDAALEGKTDRLLGLKENVIIGKLIPAATGLRRYRRMEIEPTEPIRRHTAEEIGLLDENELAAELGLTESGEIEGFGFGDGNGEGAESFTDFADLPAPSDGDAKE